MTPNTEQTCSTYINEALQIITGKWSYSVISQLCQQPQRFNQLRRNLNGISIKSLTETLRQLEQQQMVHREVFPTIPVSVQYSLTERGKEYGAILWQMREWGEKWISAKKAGDA